MPLLPALLVLLSAAPFPMAPSTSVSITVSGGVSLGAFEAGQLAYTLSTVRERTGPGQLSLATGASAGSLNALLSILAACGPEDARGGTHALFWDTWVPVGFDRLFLPSRASRLGAFSRTWLERRAADLERSWDRGLDASCDVVLGISATRLEPRVVRTAGGKLALPRVDEKFVVRIRGRGPGRPPLATNYAPAGVRHTARLVTSPSGEVAFSELRDLVFASMAFPVAFSPQPLRICAGEAPAAGDRCLPAEAVATDFVDGGVFDNGPLRLAVQLAAAGLSGEPGRLRWGEGAPGARPEVPPSLLFAYLNIDAVEYPPPAAPPRAAEQDLPRQLLAVFGAFVESARAKELALLVEERPEVAAQVLLPRRRFPAAGAPLNAFLGFFEAEFRRFDFTLGMYEAGRSLEAHHPGARPPGAADDPALQRLACMRAVYEGLPEADGACRPAALADFRALLQASLDELYDACAAAPAGQGEAWDNPACARAAAGAPPPRVPHLAPRAWPDWRRNEESELAYAVRLLGAYGFSFTDLGARGDGALALRRIREALGGAGEALAAVQPGASEEVVRFGAKVLADALLYLPPRRLLHLTLGPTETELGLSVRAPDGGGRLRLAGALGVRGLGRLFTSRESEPIALLVTGGLEVQPRAGNSGLSQVRVGLRAGWQAAAADRLGAARCAGAGGESPSSCSRPVVQALAGWTALERIRLQLVGEYFPHTPTRKTAWSIAPGVGFELGR